MPSLPVKTGRMMLAKQGNIARKTVQDFGGGFPVRRRIRMPQVQEKTGKLLSDWSPGAIPTEQDPPVP